MGESLYGKFGFDMAIIGITFLIISFFVSMLFGWMMPQNIVMWLYVVPFIFLILGIVLGIVGIAKDDLREKAVRTVIGGIIFVIVGIIMVVAYNLYIIALFP